MEMSVIVALTENDDLPLIPRRAWFRGGCILNS